MEQYKTRHFSDSPKSTINYPKCNWDGGQIAPTLTKNNAGGGRECLTKRILTASSKSGCLNASMSKGKNGMDAFNDMLVVEIWQKS